MWVRSQDKGILLNVNDICIYEIEIHKERYYEIRNYGYGDDYYILGKYSSKEKALKVLDELQKRLDDELEMNLGVFQMPRDDEVKENE